MTTIHDDRPHPIPAFAYLRYKENYFFIVMDPQREVFGISHLNNEPIFERSRFTLNLSIRGRKFAYANETKLPAHFENAQMLTDGKLSLRFVEPHKRFELAFHDDDLDLDLAFEARRPTFDFAACRTAAPENASFAEVCTLGLNLPYNHQQQSMTVSGHAVLKSDGSETAVDIAGWGYRDHSWSMRTDNIVKQHVWTGLNFADRAFGMKELETLQRPGHWAREGYVSDADGERALRGIKVTRIGHRDGWPEKLRFDFRDVLGNIFTIDADVAGRFADVDLHSEKSIAEKPAYRIIEACCPLVIRETGETGVGLVELGKHSFHEETH